jgi:hypothetical protein
MRRPWVFVGAVLAVGGLLLAYVPVTTETTPPQYIPSATSIYVIEFDAPLDVLFPRIAFVLEWSGPELSTSVSIYACHADPNCRDLPAHPLATGRGPSGNVSFLGFANQYYAIVPAGGPVDVTLHYTTPFLAASAGIALLLSGGILVVLGFTGLPRRRRREEDEDDPPAD